MGASQERAAFLSATLLVVTRHRGCIPADRQADGKFILPSRFALFFIVFIRMFLSVFLCFIKLFKLF
jgi:hypothetical protein